MWYGHITITHCCIRGRGQSFKVCTREGGCAVIHIYYSAFVGAYRNVPILNQISQDICSSLPDTYHRIGLGWVGNFKRERIGHDVWRGRCPGRVTLTFGHFSYTSLTHALVRKPFETKVFKFMRVTVPIPSVIIGSRWSINCLQVNWSHAILRVLAVN